MHSYAYHEIFGLFVGLAWLVTGCGVLYCSLLEKKEACFLMVEKSDTATIGIWGGRTTVNSGRHSILNY